MAEKPQRKGFLGFMDRLITLLDGVKGIAILLVGLSAGGGAGTLMASDKDTAARVDSLEVRMDTLEARQGRQQKQQMDFFSAQVEADSALRAVLERRAIDKQKAAQERKAVETLINLGGTP